MAAERERHLSALAELDKAVPFNWDATVDVRALRVGYLKAAFENTRQTSQTDANDARSLGTLRGLGMTPIEVRLPERPAVPTIAILYAESNATLRDPTRTSPGQLVRKDRTAAQNSFRLLPASDYLDAQRARAVIMREMARVMADVDVYVAPFDYADYTPNPVATLNTSITNLTGQPCVVVPHGFNEKGHRIHQTKVSTTPSYQSGIGGLHDTKASRPVGRPLPSCALRLGWNRYQGLMDDCALREHPFPRSPTARCEWHATSTTAALPPRWRRPGPGAVEVKEA